VTGNGGDLAADLSIVERGRPDVVGFGFTSQKGIRTPDLGQISHVASVRFRRGRVVHRRPGGRLKIPESSWRGVTLRCRISTPNDPAAEPLHRLKRQLRLRDLVLAQVLMVGSSWMGGPKRIRASIGHPIHRKIAYALLGLWSSLHGEIDA
jgi:hypothetical protein